MFPRLRSQMRTAFIVTAIIFFILFLVFWLAGCGGSEGTSQDAGCAGTVTKTYTEYKPGVGIQSGSVTIPTGSTRYYIAIKKEDGSFCSKRLDKSEWLGVTEGDTYG